MFMTSGGLGSIACAVVLLAASPVAAHPYEDPLRRFRLDVPPGWTVTVLGEDVRLVRGGSGLLISASAVETPDELVGSVTDQVAAQWSDFKEIERGSSTIAGRQAPFALFSGVNLRGTAAFLKVTVVPGRPFVFVLIATVPQHELAEVKPALDQIEQSFALPAAAPGPPPAPEPGTRLQAGARPALSSPGWGAADFGARFSRRGARA